MIQEPAFLSDAREGLCTGKQRRQGHRPNTAKDDDHHEGDLPPANAKRPTGLPLPNPTGFLLQFLQEAGPVRMPRMVVVQVANEVLGLHRNIADRAAVHLRHGDLVRDWMTERGRACIKACCGRQMSRERSATTDGESGLSTAGRQTTASFCSVKG